MHRTATFSDPRGCPRGRRFAAGIQSTEQGVRAMIRLPQKAVILLGYGSSGRRDSAPRNGAPYSAAEGPGAQAAVKEALAAGLKETIFVTPDSLTPVERQFGGFGDAKAERVVIARQFAADTLGQTLCGVRHLLGEAPFVLLLPAEMSGRGGTDTTARMLEAYRRGGGNLVAVEGEDLLERDGRFAAIAGSAAGRYLLQPAVLDALEDDPEGGLSGALLATAEAWPVTVIPVARVSAGAVPLSEAPTLRARRPVDLLREAEAGE
jgi:hypothetical protein